MDLERARALKWAALRTPALEALGTAETKGAALAERPPFAVGITGDEERGYRLAIRLQSPDDIHLPEVQEMIARSEEPVDISVTGRVRLLGALPASPPWQRTRQRPLTIGCSIGAGNDTGSLGFFARHQDGTTGFVSNNHVVANENSLPDGTPVIQPGALDGGTESIGPLHSRVTLRRLEANLVDAAFVKTSPAAGGQDRNLYDNSMLPLGPLTGVRQRIESGPVSKIGRSTGLRRGSVKTFELDNLQLDYPKLGRLVFDDQIEISYGSRPFADDGDSGAVVWDSSRRIVGLLFATANDVAYANQIGNVQRLLKVAATF